MDACIAELRRDSPFLLWGIDSEKWTFSGHGHRDWNNAGNSTFIATKIIRFQVTRAASSGCCHSSHGLGAACFCVRSSDQIRWSSCSVLHSSMLPSKLVDLRVLLTFSHNFDDFHGFIEQITQ